ncbi:MAG: enoyl-CoA hydratase/isomerase family protein [Solirubrobacterales bacterium]|nr:enoyl-CoA hydratase/isomerase family protein [Solirubrobacterales bacterium]
MEAEATAVAGVTVERREAVTVVRMDREENRLHPELLGALEAVLDGITSHDQRAALVLTGTGKYFSNGLDLEYMGANPPEVAPTLARVHALFGRVLALDVPTVAAINGHVFAAGAMLALCFDLAVMRADRGYFCLPEADLGLPFTPGMNALLTARLSPPVAHRAMVTGHRYTGADALASGIVAELAPEEEVLDRAVNLAAALVGKPRAGVGAIKRGMYASVIDALHGDGEKSG